MSADQHQQDLHEVVRVADAILALVKSKRVGGGPGEDAEFVVLGTYVHAIRRLSRIRDLAVDGAGPEAFILSRSLLSMVARAIWVDRPGDALERRRRFNRWLKHDLEEEISEQVSLEKLGADVAAYLQELRDQLAERPDVGGLPPDGQLADALGPAYYARIWKPGSGHVHYSLRSAVTEAQEAARLGAELDPERRDYALAAEALQLAILTFGLFVEQTEGTLRHRLSSDVLLIIMDSDTFVAERSRGPQG